MPPVSIEKNGEERRFRLRFHKGPELLFLGHLDLNRLVQRTFRRAGIAVKMSQGYHPKPRIAFASALPLGQEGKNEYCDASLYYSGTPEELVQALNEHSPDGLVFTAAACIDGRGESLSAQLTAAEYAICRRDGEAFEYHLLQDFLEKRSLEWVRFHKGKQKRFDIREQVLTFENVNAGGELRLKIQLGPGIQARPTEVVEAALGLPAEELIVRRQQLYINREGQLLPPM